MREIVSTLTQKDFNHFPRPFVISSENVLCFTEYDKTFGLPFIFEPQSLSNHLGEIVSKAGYTQLRVAETEKYPHVTYFLNAGIEVSYPGEDRKVVPSPRDVKTYDLKPEMSAFEVKDVVIDGLKSKQYDLIVVNFANCDMVGHSGVIEAAIKAANTVDTCLGLISQEVQQQKGALVVIADHGNAEQMIHYDSHTPHTAHTTFPVPMIVADFRADAKRYNPNYLKDGGALCDVAPTVLEILGVSKPAEMTGTSRLY
jgi:2,3-bisphosphoglycerate-independent phosphoglycerate mutase